MSSRFAPFCLCCHVSTVSNWLLVSGIASATIGTTSRTFHYGPDRQRYLQTSISGGVTRTYTYIGEHFVKEAQSGSATEYMLYIMANGEPIAPKNWPHGS